MYPDTENTAAAQQRAEMNWRVPQKSTTNTNALHTFASIMPGVCRRTTENCSALSLAALIKSSDSLPTLPFPLEQNIAFFLLSAARVEALEQID